MQRLFIVSVSIVLAQLIVVAALAQQAPQPQSAPPKAAGVEGRWTGTVQTPQGEKETAVSFKKEGDAFSGTFLGPEGDILLKNIKVDSEKVTAKADIETPQGNFVLNFTFTLKDDTLKGKAEIEKVEISGQPITFEINLKRATQK